MCAAGRGRFHWINLSQARAAHMCAMTRMPCEGPQKKQLERAFQCKIPDEVYDCMEEEMRQIENGYFQFTAIRRALMMDDKALGLLGIARRAGRLSLGHDAAKGAVLAGRARLCLISADASDRLEREFFRMTQGEKSIPLRRVRYTMEQFHRAIGAKAGVLTVDDDGFAEKLLTGEDNAYDDE